MTTRWEYLRVANIYSTNYATKQPTEAQTWEHAYWVVRPGEGDWTRADLPGLTELFNELGAEGWELTTESVSQSVIVSRSQGWLSVGRPVQTDYWFKRRVDT